MGYRWKSSLLSSSLTSPSGTDTLKDIASFSIRGINDSIFWRQATVFWGSYKHRGWHNLGEMGHTSQWFRMAESALITESSGGNASEDPFTGLIANPVVADVVGFRSDSLSGAALGSTAWSEGLGRRARSLPRTERILLEMVPGSARERCVQMCCLGQRGLHTVCLLVARGQIA